MYGSVYGSVSVYGMVQGMRYRVSIQGMPHRNMIHDKGHLVPVEAGIRYKCNGAPVAMRKP